MEIDGGDGMFKVNNKDLSGILPFRKISCPGRNRHRTTGDIPGTDGLPTPERCDLPDQIVVQPIVTPALADRDENHKSFTQGSYVCRL
ncbi:hypothetical protein H4P12_00330 [Paracoccus sp. 11-3]|uniref:Uncharacterized protein n=1 Tax=Paracoccus amoyensis TaxID=2760093 RepID=A0A926GB78_9RHOB|nr:hypothetical protein [Paracoccus amoyensis]MBC9245191.1 hypothetical protein [Paracoccus amoyensis]